MLKQNETILQILRLCVRLIVLACIIYTLFAGSPPSVDASASAVTQVWTYVGEIVFNMLVLVGTIKLSDQVVNKMMGL